MYTFADTGLVQTAFTNGAREQFKIKISLIRPGVQSCCKILNSEKKNIIIFVSSMFEGIIAKLNQSRNMQNTLENMFIAI